MMFYVWIIAANIGLWAQAFKQYKWANYVHFFFMGIVTIITWMSAFLAITAYGIHDIYIGDDHANLGIAIMVIIILQSIGGIVCWAFQKSAKIRPDIVHYINTGHHLLGYVLILLVLI